MVKANGGINATQQFGRYYRLPSVGHCGHVDGVDKGADNYSGLGAVVQWTELHQPPSSLLSTQYNDETVAATQGGGGPGGGASTSDLTDAAPVLGAADTSGVHRTLPIYPYPELPAYNGTGNPALASSYYGQVSQAVQQPTPWLGSFNSATTWCNSVGTECQTGNYSRPPWSWTWSRRQHD